tara:strand:+ start:3290 stop:3436 length:147 start_codon:yes stop_codon:yes gene_type:complete
MNDELLKTITITYYRREDNKIRIETTEKKYNDSERYKPYYEITRVEII